MLSSRPTSISLATAAAAAYAHNEQVARVVQARFDPRRDFIVADPRRGEVVEIEADVDRCHRFAFENCGMRHFLFRCNIDLWSPISIAVTPENHHFNHLTFGREASIAD